MLTRNNAGRNDDFDERVNGIRQAAIDGNSTLSRSAKLHLTSRITKTKNSPIANTTVRRNSSPRSGKATNLTVKTVGNASRTIATTRCRDNLDSRISVKEEGTIKAKRVEVLKPPCWANVNNGTNPISKLNPANSIVSRIVDLKVSSKGNEETASIEDSEEGASEAANTLPSPARCHQPRLVNTHVDLLRSAPRRSTTKSIDVSP